MRTEGCHPGWIGDLAERVEAAFESDTREGQRLMPVGDFVVDDRAKCGERDAEEDVHECYHQHRHARDAQEDGRTATDTRSHDAVRYHGARVRACGWLVSFRAPSSRRSAESRGDLRSSSLGGTAATI